MRWRGAGPALAESANVGPAPRQRLFAEGDTGNKLRTKRVAHKDNQIRGPNFHTSKLIISSSITEFRLSVESSWRHYDVIPLSDRVRA